MSKEVCAKHRDFVLLFCKELGWIVDQQKSELILQQVSAFVGIQYDLIFFTAHPIPKNWIKLIFAAQCLSSQASSSVKWQSVIEVLPLGHLHI